MQTKCTVNPSDDINNLNLYMYMKRVVKKKNAFDRHVIIVLRKPCISRTSIFMSWKNRPIFSLVTMHFSDNPVGFLMACFALEVGSFSQPIKGFKNSDSPRVEIRGFHLTRMRSTSCSCLQIFAPCEVFSCYNRAKRILKKVRRRAADSLLLCSTCQDAP